MKKENQKKLDSELVNEEGINTTDEATSYEKLGYDRYETISAFIKSLRLSKVEDALYWLALMMAANEPMTYIARRLLLFSNEDCLEPEASIYAYSLYETQKICGNNPKICDHNAILRGTLYFCRAKKFWENEQAAEDDKLWYATKDKIDRIKQGHSEEKLPIPSYALDVHTRQGLRMRREGKSIDERFSGTEIGRKNMILEFRRYGKLRPDIPFLKEGGKENGKQGRTEERTKGAEQDDRTEEARNRKNEA